MFVFALLHLSPGDPAAIIAGDTATPADIARIHQALGLDRPLYVQFGSLGLAPAARRSRHLDLHQSAGLEPDRAAGRADGRADRLDPARLGLGGDPDGRAGGMEGGHVDRPHGHGLRGARLFGAGIRPRLCADLRLRRARPICCRCRALSASTDGVVAVPVAPGDADPGAGHGLHRADRAHDPRQHARRAGAGLHPHRAGQGAGQRARC